MTPFSSLEISKGKILVATPDITSGIFSRSVIILCEHQRNGSFGIILNKTIDVQLPAEIVSIEDSPNPHIHILAGGPVQTNHLLLLHSSGELLDQTIELCHNVYLGGDLNFLQNASLDLQGPHLRLCFGYAGWESGQLEKEIREGGWFVYAGDSKYIFETQPQDIWKTILREIGGKNAMLALMPDDLSLN